MILESFNQFPLHWSVRKESILSGIKLTVPSLLTGTKMYILLSLFLTSELRGASARQWPKSENFNISQAIVFFRNF